MIRRPPRSTRTDTLFPYTTLFRSLVLARLLVGRGLRIVGIVENGLARHVGHGFNPLYLWTWWSDADGSFPSAGLVGPTNRWILWSDSSQGRPTQRASRLQALQEPSDQAAPELVLPDAVLDAGVEVRLVVDLDDEDALEIGRGSG